MRERHKKVEKGRERETHKGRENVREGDIKIEKGRGREIYR